MKLLSVVIVVSLFVISNSLIASSICERCETFSDGCNTCTCTDTGLSACTKRLCVNGTDVETPGCRVCKDGYELNPDTYACESTICGGIDNCASYYDGCNTCSGCQNDNGILTCTLKECEPDAYEDAYCESCIDGYELNEDRTACIQPCAFDNCISFNDGCNTCLCSDGEATACTLRLCLEEGTAECLKCETGYDLVNGTCEESSSTCGGIEYCDTYYDGCNTCSGCQNDNGILTCTLKQCEADAYEEAYCKSCIDGYELVNGYCVEKCLGFDNCISYSDGCNTCSCVDGETLGCTKLFCFWEGIPECLECDDGYYVVNGTCEAIPVCGEFDFCTKYNNDCNECTCGDTGIAACTLKGCDPDNPIENACLECVDGYMVNEETNECAPEGSSYCGEYCVRWSDGCNSCQCENEYSTICTTAVCIWEGVPACLACEDGYAVVNGTCQEYVPDTSCSDNCARWYDGCNWCSCTDGEIGACTKRACFDYGESYCVECNEGYEFNRYGECVESSSLNCGGFDNCVNYFDGCNWCGCDHGNITFCTLKFCPDEYYEDPYCTKCEEGYNLTASGECGKVCGGFDNCVEFYDGCNSCFCGDDGMVGCTEMFCQEYGDSYCTTCENGYELNDYNDCVEVDASISSTEEPIYCGDFKNCLAWNDGCNGCSCDGACTDMDCGEDWGEPECTLCVDGYTLYNGECIDPSVNCGYNCESWFDGCNYCFCEDGIVGGCTRMFCSNYTAPYCRDNMTSTAAPNVCEEIGGYGCITYFDGCNECTCNGYDVDCTDEECTSIGQQSCVKCVDGLTLENGECIWLSTTEEPNNPGLSNANVFGTIVGIGFVLSLLSWM